MEYEVKLARGGDRNAFESLIRANENSMYRIARVILKSDADCVDAIQETIIKSYRAIARLKHPDYFKTWLTKILINECKNILRNRNKIIAIDNINNVTYEKDAINECELLDLKQAIEKMDKEIKIIVMLYYYEDLSVKTISEILDIPEGTIKSRLHRARAYLYKKLCIDEGSCQNE